MFPTPNSSSSGRRSAAGRVATKLQPAGRVGLRGEGRGPIGPPSGLPKPPGTNIQPPRGLSATPNSPPATGGPPVAQRTNPPVRPPVFKATWQPAQGPSRDPGRGQKEKDLKSQGGVLHDTATEQAPRTSSMSAAPGALQDSPGTTQPAPRQRGGRDHAAPQGDWFPPLGPPICLRSRWQRSDADLRRPPAASPLAQLRPGRINA
ncbi:hypothetical protein NDU88_006098 [Pleurodeles waltl]|uniref:Uncharacterized protein n=1 Tax=Pleurodeles waltl TaxID=8319 RepID=A0AAV7WDQ4_PLEWA|nr:hypothetical protein NDU88_006098 [Pleurodeles waltl]